MIAHFPIAKTFFIHDTGFQNLLSGQFKLKDF